MSFLLTNYTDYIEKKESDKREKKQDLQISYEEIRDKILELNEYGEFLKNELDTKHKELLFLYQMISEKQKELKPRNQIPTQGKPVTINSIDDKVDVGDMYDVKEGTKLSDNHSQNKKIINLSLAGYNSNDIAKKLNIGKGQVELVLKLYK